MTSRRYTLISDGSSDKMLMYVLDWLLGQHLQQIFTPQWADLGRLPRPPKGLHNRLLVALETFPCELLFIHRDAEDQPAQVRLTEIQAAVAQINAPPPSVCVIPVRMQEAWFLFDEPALRAAAGNPGGRELLGLPSLKKVETLPDPKNHLFQLIRTASGQTGRRLRDLDPRELSHRLATLIKDFSPLRNLPAFRALEESLQEVIRQQGWQ